MKNITMTELNQRVSAITREVVERGEPVVVTNRGRPVLRLVPENVAPSDPLAALVAEGKARPPRIDPSSTSSGSLNFRRPRVELSKPLDEILAEERADEQV